MTDMSDRIVGVLLASLEKVHSADDFGQWVRKELRPVLPHAVMLGTLGKLFGIGSVSTHRIGVDFPLNLVEEQKVSSGALSDPLISRWLRNERPGFLDICGLSENGALECWRRTMLRYGIRGMSIHGVLDHSSRRFAAFQLGNPRDGGSIENMKLLSELSKGMSEAAWRSVGTRSNDLTRGAACHPTLGLTSTELQIVGLLAQGLSNKEIARRRGVSDSTIKTQVQRTGAKLGATRRAEIVAIAMPLLSPLPAQSMIDYDDF